MNDPNAVVFAKLAGLRKLIQARLPDDRKYYHDPAVVVHHFEQYAQLRETLTALHGTLFGDLPDRLVPVPSKTSDNDGRGYIESKHLREVLLDIDYIFEVWANSKMPVPQPSMEQRIFISHGRSEHWRHVQSYIERDINVRTLELAQEPNKGRTVIQKLVDEAGRCSAAVIVMTGDDDVTEGSPRARENVIHEIGFFQGKYGLDRVCLLHEEGTNIPSNIQGLVYIPFPPTLIDASFGALRREISLWTNPS